METIDLLDSPRDPEIVDVAAPNTWPRRRPSTHRSVSRRTNSPSIYSRYSARQSELSFGILDYYTRDWTPLHSPDLPPPPPKIDPAIGQFNFELSPKLTSPHLNGVVSIVDYGTPNARAGADREQPLIELSSIESTPPSQSKTKYSLFPPVRETPRPAKLDEPQTPSSALLAETLISSPSHQQPDASYRPRKESITSRKDSFNSYRGSSGGRHRALRIFSISSGVSGKTFSTNSASTSTASPADHSRWSDDTITSPTAATTPGPRTSFGSLLADRDGAQYPACFFEDDDQEEPLRMKLGWKRSASLTYERPGNSARGRFDEKGSFAQKVQRVLLCGCC